MADASVLEDLRRVFMLITADNTGQIFVDVTIYEKGSQRPLNSGCLKTIKHF